MSTAIINQNFEKRRAAISALSIYNATFRSFPGQADIGNTEQAATNTMANLKTLVTGRGLLPTDRSNQDRYGEVSTALWVCLNDTLAAAETDIAGDATVAAQRTSLQTHANAGVGVNCQDAAGTRNY